jgi:hypothetical protein
MRYYIGVDWGVPDDLAASSFASSPHRPASKPLSPSKQKPWASICRGTLNLLRLPEGEQ